MAYILCHAWPTWTSNFLLSSIFYWAVMSNVELLIQVQKSQPHSNQHSSTLQSPVTLWVVIVTILAILSEVKDAEILCLFTDKQNMIWWNCVRTNPAVFPHDKQATFVIYNYLSASNNQDWLTWSCDTEQADWLAVMWLCQPVLVTWLRYSMFIGLNELITQKLIVLKQNMVTNLMNIYEQWNVSMKQFTQ